MSMLLHSIRIYLGYFAQFLMARMSYKFDFFVSVITNMIVACSGLLFILFLINGESVTSIKGWLREEVLFIYGFSLIPQSVLSCFAMNLYQFGDRYIIQGQFDRVLLRPLNSLFQVLFESFNLEAAGTFITGLGVVFYAADKLAISFSAVDVLWMIVGGLSGGLILVSVFVIVASCSFHFEDRLGISAPIFNLMTFGRYPLPIFGRAIQFILCWLIPFAFVAFFPATHFLKRQGFSLLCYLTPVVAMVCVILASLAWRAGVYRYSSTGN